MKIWTEYFLEYPIHTYLYLWLRQLACHFNKLLLLKTVLFVLDICVIYLQYTINTYIIQISYKHTYFYFQNSTAQAKLSQQCAK